MIASAKICYKSSEERKVMLKYAFDLLKLQYEQCLAVVNGNEYYSKYAKEKWRHSLQVAGAGNYLVKRIEWLQERPQSYREMVKSAVFLHDVCRFAEIEHLYHGIKGYDHGVGAYEFLKHTPLFDDIRIRLPIKHHGHLISELYADEEYRNITDNDLKQEIAKICFIVRDADKIANFNILTLNENYRSLFFLQKDYMNPQNGHISDIIRTNAGKMSTLPRLADPSSADLIAGYFSWLLDINYQYSLDFCNKLGITDKIIRLFSQICIDKDFVREYTKFVCDHLQRHQFLR